MAFGKELGRVLDEKHMTVKKLANDTGIPVTTLYSAIAKDSDTVNMDYLKRICKVLGSVYSTKLLKEMGLEFSIELIPLDIDEDERKLLDCYRNLKPEGKQVLMHFAVDVVEKVLPK